MMSSGNNAHFENDGRRGRIARPKTMSLRSKAAVRNAREASFGVKGTKVESFKTVLDEQIVPGRARAAARLTESQKQHADSNAGDQTDIINRVNSN